MKLPKISIILIVYDMQRQAMVTLRSLCPDYQQGISADDYEVIVVENRSARVLDPAAVAALPGPFTYTLRDEPGKSPAAAINFALSQARGQTIGIMIDGARMLSPGVLRHVSMACAITSDALVAVPGYQLGSSPHDLTSDHTQADEIALLDQIGWPGIGDSATGYRLFEIASMSLANRAGFFLPFMESNCLFAPADVLRDLGGADERFDLPGGGALNLYLYYRLAHHPRTTLFLLPGEGSFHQIHGGVTTSSREDRDAFLGSILAQLNAILGMPFRSPDMAPILLGVLPPDLHPFLSFSAEKYAKSALRKKREAKEKAAAVLTFEDGAEPESVKAPEKAAGKVPAPKVITVPVGNRAGVE